MNKIKKHKWFVDTGLYHKQLGVITEGMEEARYKAYERFKNMSYEEFTEYISLNVAGFRKQNIFKSLI